MTLTFVHNLRLTVTLGYIVKSGRPRIHFLPEYLQFLFFLMLTSLNSFLKPPFSTGTALTYILAYGINKVLHLIFTYGFTDPLRRRVDTMGTQKPNHMQLSKDLGRKGWKQLRNISPLAMWGRKWNTGLETRRGLKWKYLVLSPLKVLEIELRSSASVVNAFTC